MPVPNTFANATATIPLSQLDANFATTITLGNTAIQLGNTVSTLNNMTLANVTVTSGNVTLTNVTVTTANVTTANIATEIVTTSQTLNYGTANGVVYLNGSKVATTGTALSFDATNLAFGTVGAKVNFATTGSATQNYVGLASDGFSMEISTLRGASQPITYRLDYASGHAWSIAGTQRMLLDLSGNLGLGATPSAWGSPFRAFQFGTNGGLINFRTDSNQAIEFALNWYYDGSTSRYINTNFATRYRQFAGGHEWYTAPSGTAGNAITFTQAMTLDASGNLGIGTTSPSTYGKFVAYSSGGYGSINTDGHFESYQLLDVATAGGRFRGGSSQGILGRIDINQVTTGAKGGEIRFFTCPSGSNTETERGRITSGGYSKFSNDGTYFSSAGAYHELRNSASDYCLLASCTSTGTPYGIYVRYPNLDPNNVGSAFLECVGGTTTRALIRSNGGISNYTANNSPLSDRRLKRDITPAGSYLEKICSIPVVNYFYNDQTDDLVNLGVIAQDVLAAAPELCNEEGWGTKAEDGTNYLGIWETDIMYALMKSIQELKAELDATKAEVALLKGAK